MITATIETAIDTFDFLSNRRMAKASDGRLWVIYRDKDNGTYDVKVAYSDDGGATWTSEVVDAGGSASAQCALAVDSNDEIHVVWCDRVLFPVMQVWLWYRSRTSAGVWSAIVELYAPALELQVTASGDDCVDENNPANFSIVHNEVHVGDVNVGSFDWASGMRFLNVDIPQGATIVHAWLSIRTYGGAPGTLPTTIIEGEAHDNAIIFSDIADYDARVRTGSSVNWTPAAWTAWNTSPDIAAIIQEIVDRPGWLPNSAMALFWSHAAGWGGVDNQLDGYSYDRSAVFAPKLHIEYEIHVAHSFSAPLEPDIAIDQNDDIHVAWMAWSGYPTLIPVIKYVKRTGAAWGTLEDAASNLVDTHMGEPSIAIDSSNFPHIAFYKDTPLNTYNIFYVWRTALGWQPEESVSVEVNPAGIHEYPQLVLDSADDAHVVWMAYNRYNSSYPAKPNIYYRKRTAGVWGAEERVTDVDYNQGYGVSIALNTDDTIHVIWSGQGWGANPGEYCVQHRQSSVVGVWSTQNDLVNGAGYNYLATSLCARYPPSNILTEGYAFIYVSENTLSDLEFLASGVAAVSGGLPGVVELLT